MVLLGIAYTIYASSLWACIPYVVKPNALGTAFGITMAIQNIGLSFVPSIGNLIADNTKHIDYGYYYVIVANNLIGGNILGSFSLCWCSIWGLALNRRCKEW